MYQNASYMNTGVVNVHAQNKQNHINTLPQSKTNNKDDSDANKPHKVHLSNPFKVLQQIKVGDDAATAVEREQLRCHNSTIFLTQQQTTSEQPSHITQEHAYAHNIAYAFNKAHPLSNDSSFSHSRPNHTTLPYINTFPPQNKIHFTDSSTFSSLNYDCHECMQSLFDSVTPHDLIPHNNVLGHNFVDETLLNSTQLPSTGDQHP